MLKFLSSLIASPALYVVLGALFLLLGITGGGITSKWLALPPILPIPRVAAGAIGAGLLSFGLYVVRSTAEISRHRSASPSDSAGLESLDCSESQRSVDYVGEPRPCSVEFRNDSAKTVKLFWVKTDGSTDSYFELGPHQSNIQSTYAGHVWVVKDDAGRCVAMFRCVLPRAVIGDMADSKET